MVAPVTKSTTPSNNRIKSTPGPLVLINLSLNQNSVANITPLLASSSGHVLSTEVIERGDDMGMYVGRPPSWKNGTRGLGHETLGSRPRKSVTVWGWTMLDDGCLVERLCFVGGGEARGIRQTV